MPNKNIFHTGTQDPNPTDTFNGANAPAYKLTHKAILAQLVSTGTISDSFYTKASDQFADFMASAEAVDSLYLAQLAIYSRQNARMKDMPALLCAILSIRDQSLFKKIFPLVIDNPRVLRTFVQIMRSGKVGRRSLGSLPKRMIKEWIEARSDDDLFRASIGNDPSFKDILCLVHPKPRDKTQDALFENLVDKKDEKKLDLPKLVRDYSEFKSGQSEELPKGIPFLLLTSSPLSQAQWKIIARSASWTEMRMNLNTYQRHGVFEGDDAEEIINQLAKKLEDPMAIARAKALPYQLLAAYETSLGVVPERLSKALAKATEIALENVPSFGRSLYVMLDVSGSMSAFPVTGFGSTKPTSVKAIDAAALIAAALLRKNKDAEVIAFAENVKPMPAFVDRCDLFKFAEALKEFQGGGTDCSAPLSLLNHYKATGDLLIMISDNESWFMAGQSGQSSRTQTEWIKYKIRNPNARMICIDLAPNKSTQIKSNGDVLNVGGFSDEVFKVIEKFLESNGERNFVNEIESISIDL